MENNFKRFLSLLLALVMVITLMPLGHVHAEGETVKVLGEKVTSVEADVQYVICLAGTMNAVTNEQGSNGWGTHTLATANCSGQIQAKSIWTLETADGGFKLKNVGGYANVSRNTANLNETGHLFELVYHEGAGWAIKSLETNEYFNNLDDSGSIGGWSGDGTKFDIYTVTEKSLDEIDPWGKRNWVVVSVDTETVYDAKEGQFEYAWDNNPASHWHSNWQGATDKLTGENTFTGVIDFGKAYFINRFSFTPRTDRTGTGCVTQASLYVKASEDADWIAVAEHATFADDNTKKDIDFYAQEVRFVKFVAEQSNDGWVTVSEFDIDYIAPVEPPVEPELTRVAQLVANMSLRDKVTQMMMVDFRKWGADVDSATDFTVMNEEVRKIIEGYNFGSIILFANNIKETAQSYNLVYAMQEAATKDDGLALIICADQEGGSVYRLGSGTALPGNMALGATYALNGTKYAKWAGQIIGSELSVLGINGNLAPVVDVNNNANNPVIGLRSYGDDATMVGELASASIAGMAEYNVIGTAKHFPGHGDTDTDSHTGLPIVDKSLDVLKEVELKPYEVAIDQGIEMIMTAHILYPQLESDKIVSNKTGEAESLPATMSDDILTGLLKEQMGFEGIIVTDAMNMAGVAAKWDQVQSCVIAIQAGVDLICMPCRLYCQADLANLDAIIDGIIAAVEDGTIPMERINDAVTRILTVKENRGILDYNAADYSLEKAQSVVGSKENRDKERELAAAAVTVVKNDGTLPLNLTSESKVLMLVPYTNEISQMLMAWNRAKEAGVIPMGAQVDYFRFASDVVSDELQAKLDWADTYIINSEISSTSRFSGNHWLYAMPTKLCDYAAANGKTAIISSVDKPYDVQMYANANAIVAAYGCKGSSVDPTEALIGGATGSAAAYGPNIIAAVEVILGTYGAQGKLPVNIPVYDAESNSYLTDLVYERGYGLTYEAAHRHSYEAEVTEPTCTEEGYTTYTCECGEIYVDDEVSALGHTSAEAVKENEKAATCTEDGSYDSVVYCSVCEAEISRETVTVEATGHTAAEAVRENEKAATCGEAGSYDSVVYCSVCNAEISRETITIVATGEHTAEIIPGTPATFDNTGLTEGKRCSVCGEILVAQETIPALDYNQGIVPIEKLTATAGDVDNHGAANQGPAALVLDNDLTTMWHTDWYGTSRANHWIQFELSDWYAVSGLRYKPRTDLNREGQPQLNGTITEYKIQVSNDGIHFEDVVTGNWDANQNWKTVEFEAITAKYIRLVAVDACTDNDSVFASAAEIRLVGVETEAPPHEHSFGEWTVTTPATCTEKGVETRTCSCGESETREIAALGHDYAAVVTAPTCTEGGYTTYTCTRCSNSYVADETAALGHTEVTLEAKAATCTETGLTEGKKCSVCGEITVEQEVIPALGHDYENGFCTRCDAVNNPFTDVPAGEFYFEPVLWAVEKGITTGVSETTFAPGREVTRAEVVTFLWRAAGSPDVEGSNPFTDVNEADHAAFYKAILWALEKGITTGKTATTFDPLATCTRAEALTFLWRAAGKPESTAAENFDDVKDGDFFQPAVLWAVENKITNGIDAKNFGSYSICNRAHIVTFLYRAEINK